MGVINRLDEVFEERKVTNRVIAKYLSKSEGTVSKWRNNRRQPSLDDLDKIAELLRMETKDLINQRNWSRSKAPTYSEFKRLLKEG